VVTAIVGFYLISGAFGYASILVTQLQNSRDSLVDSNRDLDVIHDLPVSLKSAADVEKVQERVLEALAFHLGVKRAAVGLADQVSDLITGWLGWARDGHILLTSDLLKSSLQSKPVMKSSTCVNFGDVVGPGRRGFSW